MEGKPIEIKTGQPEAPEAMSTTSVQPIGANQLRKFTQVLEKYKSGKSQTESRVLASENWWKLRTAVEEKKVTNIGADG